MFLALSNWISQAIIAVFKTSHVLETYVAQLYSIQYTSLRGKSVTVLKSMKKSPKYYEPLNFWDGTFSWTAK